MTGILEVENLSVDYATPSSTVRALRSVSLTVDEGMILSIVGESGSGKSTFALAVSKLLPRNAIILEGGKISFRGKDLMELKKPQIRQVRGTGIFMIFQNVFLSLNPLMRIKRQVVEAIDVRSKRTGEKPEKKNAEGEVTSILKSVRIGDAEDVMERYPHQLSGGQNQRIMLAMALA